MVPLVQKSWFRSSALAAPCGELTEQAHVPAPVATAMHVPLYQGTQDMGDKGHCYLTEGDLPPVAL